MRSRIRMSRILSVDTVKVFAIVAVVALHTTPFYDPEGSALYSQLFVAINQVARFAVPFFFVISGYFFAKKIARSETILGPTLERVKKLGLLWLFFSFIYILPYKLPSAFGYGIFGPFNVMYLKLENAFNDPVKLLFEGSMVHLWFLVSLVCSMVITALFIRFWKVRPLLFLGILSVTLYVFGLLAHSYSETPLGISIAFNTRNGPFFSTLFFVMGYALSFVKISRKHFFYGLFIMVIGYFIHFGEMRYLYFEYAVPMASHDYLVGTLFVGLGVSLMALSGHSVLQLRRLSLFSKYTLGVYGVHVVFVDILIDTDNNISNPAWEIGFVIIVLLLSIATTWLLSRVKPLKKLLV